MTLVVPLSAEGGGAAEEEAGMAQAASGSALSVTSNIEDGVAEITATGANGEIRLMGAISRSGDAITLDRTHIEGAGPGSSSLSEIRAIINEFGKQQKATSVTVQGGARTTGLHQGKLPRPITINVQ